MEEINKLIKRIPFGDWQYAGKVSPFIIDINHLIFFDLVSLLEGQTNYTSSRFYSESEFYKDYLLYETKSTENEKIEQSFSILESKGIKISDDIKKRKDFFSFLNFYEFQGGCFGGVVILKSVEVGQTEPPYLYRDLILPDGVKLIPAKMAYQISFLLSNVITEEFMNVFELYTIIMMNEPLEKLNKNDESLFFELRPKRRGAPYTRGCPPYAQNASISLTSYIDSGQGLCFLCKYPSIFKRKFEF